MTLMSVQPNGKVLMYNIVSSTFALRPNARDENVYESKCLVCMFVKL
jgi:hypothetical protein